MKLWFIVGLTLLFGACSKKETSNTTTEVATTALEAVVDSNGEISGSELDCTGEECGMEIEWSTEN